MPAIPKIAFAIWFGGVLPKHCQQNLIALKQINSDYDVRLITDRNTLSDEDHMQLRQFCLGNAINLVNIREHKDKLKAQVFNELDRAKAEKSIKLKKIHYVRASDLTRCWALYCHGGIYFEPDIKPKKAFGSLQCSSGMLVTVYNPSLQQASEVGELDILTSLSYDFLIALPKLSLFRDALSIHLQDELYFQSLGHNMLLQDSSSRQGLRAYVIATTGSLLFYGLTQFYLQSLDSIQNNKDTLIASHFVDRDNDNSWLPEQNSKMNLETKRFVEQCVFELHSRRLHRLDSCVHEHVEVIRDMIMQNIMPEKTAPRRRWEPIQPLPLDLRRVEQPVSLNTLLESGFFNPKCSSYTVLKKESPKFEFDTIQVKKIDVEMPTIEMPKLYLHRHGFFGRFSPPNIFRNLVNHVPWDATTTQRNDILNARNANTI